MFYGQHHQHPSPLLPLARQRAYHQRTRVMRAGSPQSGSVSTRTLVSVISLGRGPCRHPPAPAPSRHHRHDNSHLRPALHPNRPSKAPHHETTTTASKAGHHPAQAAAFCIYRRPTTSAALVSARCCLGRLIRALQPRPLRRLLHLPSRTRQHSPRRRLDQPTTATSATRTTTITIAQATTLALTLVSRTWTSARTTTPTLYLG